ncbi:MULTISPECIES: hypothetical protein [unclassified Okeania]|nr:MULTISPECIES: hypothetical protein [unclassified Okeania]
MVFLFDTIIIDDSLLLQLKPLDRGDRLEREDLTVKKKFTILTYQ